MAVSRTDFENFSYVQIGGAGATAETDLLEGPCRVTDIHIKGMTSAGYLKFYDNTSPTVGTTAPDYCWAIGSGYNGPLPLFGKALKFANGLSVAAIKHVDVADGPGTSGTTAADGTVAVSLGMKKGLS